MDANLCLDLESRGEHGKALHETTCEDAIAGEDVGETAAEHAREEARKQLVSEHVAAAIRVLFLVPTRADNHVELLSEEHVDHHRRGLRIVGEIAVGNYINVGVNV